MPTSKHRRGGKNRKRKVKNIVKEKNRYVYASGTSSEDGKISGNIDWERGVIQYPTADPGTVKTVIGYERDSGKFKTIFSYGNGSNEAYLDEMSQLKNSFDYVAAIDTNTIDIKGTRISLSSVCRTLNNLSACTTTVDLSLLNSFLIVNPRAGVNPEAIGWHLFMLHHLPSLNIPTGKKLGLIVDSDLDRHTAINNRQIPYFKDFLLPENVHLIYASSDSNEGFSNKAISWCDRTSKDTLLNFKNGSIIIPETVNGTEDYDGYFIVPYNK